MYQKSIHIYRKGNVSKVNVSKVNELKVKVPKKSDSSKLNFFTGNSGVVLVLVLLFKQESLILDKNLGKSYHG